MITAIQRAGDNPDYWLVTIKGIGTAMPIRDRKLRRYRRFCNAIAYRFVTFAPMEQAEWKAIVEQAMAESGAP